MNNLINILNKFSEKKVLAIGDIMLDEYLEGNVERISPEAPIQIVVENNAYYKLGGVGNVVSNLATLGSQVILFSFVGKDNEAEILKNLLDEKKINYFFGINNITTKKTRIIGNKQQLLRLDREENFSKTFPIEIKKNMLEKAKQSDIIIISDYAKGAVTDDLIDTLASYKKKIIINPKPVNKKLCKNIFLVMANEKETKEMSESSDIYASGEKLRKKFNSYILVTRGEKGMTLFSENRTEIPTYAKEVYDVQGAGDTTLAAVALSICSGASLEEAAIIGNYAAGIAVEKRGTYSVKLNELEKRILGIEKKIVNLEELKKIVDYSREENKKIVWTNGCFDLFHLGHKYSLEKAKEQGNILIVGLDSDESVRKLKGPNRPICDQNERAEILSSIEFVDYITIFPPESVIKYLQTLKPDVYVKSGDYTLETINQEERKVVEKYGGKIFLPKGIPNLSTTKILEKIKSIQNESV